MLNYEQEEKMQEELKKKQQLEKLSAVLASELCAMAVNCHAIGNNCADCVNVKYYNKTAVNLYNKGLRVKEK